VTVTRFPAVIAAAAVHRQNRAVGSANVFSSAKSTDERDRGTACEGHFRPPTGMRPTDLGTEPGTNRAQGLLGSASGREQPDDPKNFRDSADGHASALQNRGNVLILNSNWWLWVDSNHRRHYESGLASVPQCISFPEKRQTSTRTNCCSRCNSVRRRQFKALPVDLPDVAARGTRFFLTPAS